MRGCSLLYGRCCGRRGLLLNGCGRAGRFRCGAFGKAGPGTLLRFRRRRRCRIGRLCMRGCRLFLNGGLAMVARCGRRLLPVGRHEAIVALLRPAEDAPTGKLHAPRAGQLRLHAPGVCPGALLRHGRRNSLVFDQIGRHCAVVAAQQIREDNLARLLPDEGTDPRDDGPAGAVAQHPVNDAFHIST